MFTANFGAFQDASFVRDLQDSKSTSGGVFCAFGSETCFQFPGCATNKQQLFSQQCSLASHAVPNAATHSATSDVDLGSTSENTPRTELQINTAHGKPQCLTPNPKHPHPVLRSHALHCKNPVRSSEQEGAFFDSFGQKVCKQTRREKRTSKRKATLRVQAM